VTLAALTLPDCPPATDGDIALANHYSSLDRNWRVFRRWPDRLGTAEQIVDGEIRSAHFMGDATALDRLAELSSEVLAQQPQSAANHLIAAEIASTRHHFVEAQRHLVEAASLGARQDDITRLRLTLDQAMGKNLSEALDERRKRAQASGAIQDLVPLGALLADLGEFEEADQTYLRAIQSYRDLSPFPLAWTCFQLGMLWGEIVPEPDLPLAKRWYQQAIRYLPAYTHARVHLAEIHLDLGELTVAEAFLRPVQESGDPEVKWRLTEVLVAQALETEAEKQLDAARGSFKSLLTRHELAFADHAAEFYLSAGDNVGRAFELARINLSNRPTLRAFELAHRAALASGETRLADELAVRARAKWCHTKALLYSLLAERNFPDLLANGADT